jgi:ubiquitin-protein ligase E3 C
MSFNNFSGSYKNKRHINLGGTVDIKSKEHILMKANLERKKRENERLRLESAIKLQSFYRGRKIAKQFFQDERTAWHEKSDNSLSRLIFFFDISSETDYQKLELLCSYLIEENRFLNVLKSSNYKYIFSRICSYIFQTLRM